MEGKTGKGTGVKDTQSAKKTNRRAKPLLDTNDPLRSLNRILNQLIIETNGEIPEPVRQALISANDKTWTAFVEMEQRLQEVTR